MRKNALLLLSLLLLQLGPASPLNADTTISVGVYQNEPLVFTDSDGNIQGIYIDILEYVASKDYNVYRSPLICCPIELRFAAPEGKNQYLLNAIDRHLVALKGDKESIYYQSLNKWLGDISGPVFSGWLKWGLALAGVLLLLFLGGNIALRSQVKAKTAELSIKNKELQEEIAERKRVVEALRESEERYRRLVGLSFDAIVIHSEGKVVYVNVAGAELFGVSRPEELIGKPILDFVHPDYLEMAKARMLQTTEGRVAPLIEEKLIRLDGTDVDLEVMGIPTTYQGKPAMQVVFRDITERKRAEEALRESEEKYRLHFEHVSDVIYSIDPDFRILSVSPSVERILGYRPEELIGKPFQDLNLLTEEYLETAFSDAKRVLAGERISSSVYEFIAKDGTNKFGEVSSAPLVRDGKVAAVISVARDITERKQLETQLRQVQKLESIGQLASGIAHDFNNLLTPIGGFAELLLRKASKGSKEQKHLRQIKIAAQRATALTSQLRLFTRQEEGELRPLQLNSVVEETCALLEHSIPKEITIELSLESELWAVEADSSQISQVLMNLCVNARDAMPNGGTLTLETRNMTLDEEYARTVLTAQPGRYVCLSVSDTGCGMSPEVQARLFEPFFTTKEPGKGTGLGLAVVYGIVKGHGGFINVYSEKGRRSTFRIYLPPIESAMEEREVEEWKLPTGTETILLVDDEEAVRALGQSVLERCGYTVLTAENGIRALEVYQAHQEEIALMVLDVGMPQMGGQECLRRLQELDPQVKVLISTGYTAKGLAQELVAEGALGVVEKPFPPQDFAAVVRRVLDRG
jgi:PAS domain S-box-containing protein